MASRYVVKGPAGEYFSNFEERCEKYLTNLWPDWKTNDRTYMFPPVFPCRYISPTGEASGAVKLTKAEIDCVKGDFAELQIFQVLEKFGQETDQPMFVFSQFKYKEFIEKVLPNDHPLFASLVTRFVKEEVKEEIDFVVLHRRIGVILIEVKANEKFRSPRYKDAKEKLEVVEEFARVFLKAKGIDIPVYKVVAMPNVSDEGRSPDGYINLRKIHLQMDDKGNVKDLLPFEGWWKQNFTERSLGEHEKKFLSLISLFVGQRATICATAQILRGVFQTIDRQSFLQQSQKKIKKNKGCESPAVVRPKEEGPSILARQFMFLNEEQLAIWRGEKKQLFCGAAGTGKTILIQHKALECAKNDEKVLIFVPTFLGKLYKKFFSSNGILCLHFNYKRDKQYSDFLKKFLRRGEPCKETVLIVTVFQVPLFLPSVKSVAKEEVNEFHVFVDEFQSFTETGILTDFLICHQSPSFYQWVAYNPRHILPTDEDQNTFERVVSNLCATEKFHHAPSLTTVMRCTSEIFWAIQKYVHPILQYSAEDKFAQTYWTRPIHLGHHVSGPRVVTHRINKLTFVKKCLFCLKTIKDEINEWAKIDDTYEYNRVAILVPEQRWIDQLSSYLQKEGVPVCSIREDENAITLDYMVHAQSYEWPVVITISEYEHLTLNSVPLSRAVTRLVAIWTVGKGNLIP